MNFISKDSYLEEVVSPGIRTLQSRKGHVLTEGAGESWGAGGGCCWTLNIGRNVDVERRRGFQVEGTE